MSTIVTDNIESRTAGSSTNINANLNSASIFPAGHILQVSMVF